MFNFSTMGDWCKWLERNFSPETMIPTLPVIIRLDGVNFHKWTRGLESPFDTGFNDLMLETTKRLVLETNAAIGYTQSDEITLVLYEPNRKSAIYHAGKKQKILSKLTGVCVTTFNEQRKIFLPEYDKLANFDARIYQVPTLDDAAVQILWRENDAVKNSISCLAQRHFSPKAVHGLNGNQLQDKLMLEKGVNWNDLPVKFKRGRYIRRVKTVKPFTIPEIEGLPLNHDARRNPNLTVERSIISEVEFPIFSKVKNRAGVIFFGEEPEVTDE